jgi:hypothetical protein
LYTDRQPVDDDPFFVRLLFDVDLLECMLLLCIASGFFYISGEGSLGQLLTFLLIMKVLPSSDGW